MSDPTASRQARAALRDIPELDPIREEAELVISELVSNAVVHSGAGDGDTITVDVCSDDDLVRLSVHDPGRSNSSPEMMQPDRTRVGGVGLFVVSRLATRWDTERDDGVVVWAELSLHE